MAPNMISGDAKAEAEVEVEVAQTTRALPREEPRQIRDGNSDLNQKIEHVVRKSCGGRHAPLLLQFWTLKEMGSPFPFVLQTQSSHSFTVTPNDELRSYWEKCRVDQMPFDGPPRVSMSYPGWRGFALANLLLPVYLPVMSEKLYAEYFVGMLQIVSKTEEMCLQFFKDAGVRDLFQKEGLICLDAPQHLGMQLDVSTQGGEVPSNDFVDYTEQFPPKADLNDKDQFVTWARDVYKIKHDVSTQGTEVPSNDFVDNTEQFTPSVPSNDFVDNTEQFTPEGVPYDKNQFVRWARDLYKNDGVVLVIRSSKDDKIYFRCERHGKASATKKNGQTSSKKCNCPFQIVGSKKKKGTWSLRKIDGSHNH